MTKIASILFFILFAITIYAQNDSVNNLTIYTVKTEISELKNQTLECKVRNHLIGAAIDNVDNPTLVKYEIVN